MTAVAEVARRRVLFVDDEPAILSGLEMLLRRDRKRWDMVFALGGDRALEALREKPFDVVVTDMRMPKIDGAKLLAMVRDQWPATVRIILSGDADRASILQSLPSMHQFLSKPCDPETLRAAIERCLRSTKLAHDSEARSLVGRLESLPSPPAAYLALTKLVNDPKSNLNQAAAVIATDPSMAAKVLQIANSAAFGQGKKTISIDMAVRYLGLELIRAISLAGAVFAPRSGSSSAGLAFDELQATSLRIAAFAKTIVRDKKRADEAFIGGLLHDVGQIVLAVGLPDEYRAMLDEIRQTGEPLCTAEHRTFGAHHGDVGAQLLGMWGLPPSITDTVALHHQPRAAGPELVDVITAVHVADALLDPRGGTAIDHQFLHDVGFEAELATWTTLAGQFP